PLPPGEGWGWSGEFAEHAPRPRNGPGLQAGARTASEGGASRINAVATHLGFYTLRFYTSPLLHATAAGPHPNPPPEGEGAGQSEGRMKRGGEIRPMLETRDLTIRFGGHVAVDRVSCAFAPGTLTTIVGPNGAGKTTYFNLISGQIKASAGRVS